MFICLLNKDIIVADAGFLYNLCNKNILDLEFEQNVLDKTIDRLIEKNLRETLKDRFDQFVSEYYDDILNIKTKMYLNFYFKIEEKINSLKDLQKELASLSLPDTANSYQGSL